MLTDDELVMLMQSIMVTAEAMGDTLSASAAAIMADDLSDYPLPVVQNALRATRRESKGRLALADVLKRVQAADGHPEGNEAWAIAVVAADEAQTVVWTPQIAAAWFAAEPLIDAKGNVAARMAFLSAYEREVKAARESRTPARWEACLGHDACLRESALTQAVESGRISASSVAGLLPAPMSEAGAAIAGLLTHESPRAIPAPAHIIEQLEALIREADVNEQRRRADYDAKLLRDREEVEAVRAQQLAALEKFAQREGVTHEAR